MNDAVEVKVAPCELDGVTLPDHGEVWARGWALNENDIARGCITTSIALATMPLRLQRRISLANNKVDPVKQPQSVLEGRQVRRWHVSWTLG